MSLLLALDPALSTTGYAIINIEDYNLIAVNKFSTSNTLNDDNRINLIVKHLYSIAKDYNIDYIVFEDGFLGVNKKTSLQLATLRGAIIGLFKFKNFKVYHLLTTEIRKLLNISGKAKKEDVANILSMYYNNLDVLIGSYSDKHNKYKTSDMYDAIATGVAFINFLRGGDYVINNTKR